MAPQLLEGTVADRPRSEAIRKPRAVWPSNPVAALWGTMVGKKVVMAATGVVLVGFVIAHMLGNLKIFLGAEAIDTYAVFLRTMGSPMLPYSGLLWGGPRRPPHLRRAAHHRRRPAHAHELGRSPARLQHQEVNRHN